MQLEKILKSANVLVKILKNGKLLLIALEGLAALMCAVYAHFYAPPPSPDH
jgi:hypothetical protein